jgi:uncharacterized lipoprotein YddW (UPF0748 family)
MRRALFIIAAYSLFLLSAVLPLQKAAAPKTNAPPLVIAPAPPGEARALWVVRTSMTSPESVIQMVRRAKEAGFTDLIVQVRGRGDAYYDSRWEPRAMALAGADENFDPLGLTIEQAHAAGLKVHAWVNAFLVADSKELPTAKDHIIWKHPDWLAVPKQLGFDLYRGNPKAPNYFERILSLAQSSSEELEGLYLSPAHPAVKEQLYGVWIDILERYAVDGMHFDYIRYPNPQFDYSRTSIERFRSELEKVIDARERERLAKIAEDDPLIYTSAYPDRYAQFQRDQVTDVVERIYTGVKARKPEVIVSAAVWANDDDAYGQRFQDWKLWLRRGLLDVVCPMAYSTNTDTFSHQIADAVKSARTREGLRVWAGIGAWLLPVEGSLARISAARTLGSNGFILFSYDSVVAPSAASPQGNYLLRVQDALKSQSFSAAN